MSSAWPRSVAVLSATAIAIACLVFATPAVAADSVDDRGSAVIAPEWVDGCHIEDAIMVFEAISSQIDTLEERGYSVYVYIGDTSLSSATVGIVAEGAQRIIGEDRFIDGEGYDHQVCQGATVFDSVSDRHGPDTGFLRGIIGFLEDRGLEVPSSDSMAGKAIGLRVYESMMSLASSSVSDLFLPQGQDDDDGQDDAADDLSISGPEPVMDCTSDDLQVTFFDADGVTVPTEHDPVNRLSILAAPVGSAAGI